MTHRKTSTLERFLKSIAVRESGCWEWTGWLTPKGYGRFSANGHAEYTHRYAFEVLTGRDIPQGFDVDHLCRNRRCVNPDHLEPVERLVNVRRGIGSDYMDSGLCAHGHPYSAENTVFNGAGHRECRICRRDQRQRQRSKARGGIDGTDAPRLM